jgi:CRISPR/Cas system-associated protein Csm6
MPPRRPAHTIDALYAIGRNVVNFQRLERILKQLAMWAPVCAASSTLQRVVETRRAKAERLTLGEAVKKWIESECHHAPNQNKAPQPDDQIRISFGFELPMPPKYLDQLSDELESLAQERNSLIHQDLAQMNFEDEAECIALSTQLNAQNERIIRATKFLEPILTQMQEFARLIASDEGLIQELVRPTFVEEDAE